MNGDSPSEQLIALLDQAFRSQFLEGEGLNHVEPIFIEVLKLLSSDSRARKWFTDRATEEIVSGGKVISDEMSRPYNFIDADLICFIAHANKWDEFRQAIALRKQSADYARKLPGSSDIADLVEAAMSDQWEDRDFYKSFEE